MRKTNYLEFLKAILIDIGSFIVIFAALLSIYIFCEDLFTDFNNIDSWDISIGSYWRHLGIDHYRIDFEYHIDDGDCDASGNRR